jgi:hypothetical protein
MPILYLKLKKGISYEKACDVCGWIASNYHKDVVDYMLSIRDKDCVASLFILDSISLNNLTMLVANIEKEYSVFFDVVTVSLERVQIL